MGPMPGASKTDEKNQDNKCLFSLPDKTQSLIWTFSCLSKPSYNAKPAAGWTTKMLAHVSRIGSSRDFN